MVTMHCGVFSVYLLVSAFLLSGLNTDHNEVMKQLEAVSARLLSKTRAGAEVMDSNSTATRPPTEPPSGSVPFLLVDQVTPGSPADLAVSVEGMRPLLYYPLMFVITWNQFKVVIDSNYLW